MNLAVRTETLVVDEDHSWLRSKHGIEATRPIQIDGAAFGAVYATGFAKSGTIVAKNSSTGRWVPYDDDGSNATDTAVGILFTTIDIRDGAGSFVNAFGALMTHGVVVTSKLPRSAVQDGGPYAGAIADLPLIQFV